MEHQRATKLFIGGLPGSVTSESMREYFSQFGKVVDSTVMLDRETGRSKGFGFISFEDTDVRPFLGFGNLEIDGKLVSAYSIYLFYIVFFPSSPLFIFSPVFSQLQ
jgi:RNA-binding protein Musashi